MDPNEDVRDLSEGDCDVPKSDKVSTTSGIYWIKLDFINNCKEP